MEEKPTTVEEMRKKLEKRKNDPNWNVEGLEWQMKVPDEFKGLISSGKERDLENDKIKSILEIIKKISDAPEIGGKPKLGMLGEMDIEEAAKRITGMKKGGKVKSSPKELEILNKKRDYNKARKEEIIKKTSKSNYEKQMKKLEDKIRALGDSDFSGKKDTPSLVSKIMKSVIKNKKEYEEDIESFAQKILDVGSEDESYIKHIKDKILNKEYPPVKENPDWDANITDIIKQVQDIKENPNDITSLIKALQTKDEDIQENVRSDVFPSPGVPLQGSPITETPLGMNKGGKIKSGLFNFPTTKGRKR